MVYTILAEQRGELWALVAGPYVLPGRFESIQAAYDVLEADRAFYSAWLHACLQCEADAQGVHES